MSKPDFKVTSYGYSLQHSVMTARQVADWVRAIRDNGKRGDDGCGTEVEYTHRAMFDHVDGGRGIEHIIRYKTGMGHTLKIGLRSRTVTHYMTS